MEKTIPKKNSYLTPCLPLEASDTGDKKEESDYVTFTLKVRAGQTGTSAPSYKMKVAKFEDGTATEWIEVMNALEEIWKQNSLTTASDRQASVKTILREDALTAFEASIDEDLEPEEGAPDNAPVIQLSTEMIDDALISVSKNIFPHRALEIQKIWMRRQIKKPKSMPVRKMTAIITKMNNSLARFPEADESDKFKDKELLEIIEWSLPDEWRRAFDLKGYVPSNYGKKRLIAEAEAIERAETLDNGKHKAKEGKSKSFKSNKEKKANPKSDKSSKTEYFCTEHGVNKTHGTAECFTIKNRKDKQQPDKKQNNRSFSTDKFRKEINMFSKGKNKKEVLNLYAAEINNQRRQMAKAKVKSARKANERSNVTSSDEDNTNDAHNIVECPIENIAVRKKRKVTYESNEGTEEQAFKNKIANLGQTDEATEETSVSSEESLPP